MPAPQNFRSAFNGFHREDVVRYLEYINAKHNAQINQMNSENEYLRNRVESQPSQEETDALREQVEALTLRCQELEAQLEAAAAAAPVVEAAPVVVPVAAPASNTNEELEAYRRAERTERLARERAELVYHQVNGVLAEATARVEKASSDVGGMADHILAQITQLSMAVSSSKQALKDAASVMYAIRPDNNRE